MEKCLENAHRLPDGVNETLFASLATQGNAGLLKIIELLPPEIRESFLSQKNSSEIKPTNKKCEEPGSDPDFSLDFQLIAAYGWILLLTAIIGIIGNLIVLAVHFRKPKEISPYKLSLIHLAFCDLTFACFQIIGASPAIYVSPWPYGDVGCKAIKSAMLLGGMVAIGTLLVIAMERYFAVLRPLHRKNRGKRIAIGLGIVWIVSLTSLIPVSMTAKYSEERQDCEDIWDSSGFSSTFGYVYSYYHIIVFFLAPLFFITVAYSKIVKCLWNSSAKGNELLANCSVDVIQKRRRDDRRRVKILLVIVLAFIICVLPGNVYWIIVQHVDVESLDANWYYGLLYTGLLPYPFHVAVNPVIYSVVDPNFRKSARALFASFFTCPSRRTRQHHDLILMESQERRHMSKSSTASQVSV